MATTPYRHLLANLTVKQRELDQSRQAAERDFEHLLTLTPEARLRRIQRAHSRFRHPILADLLIEESRQQLTAVPAAALSLAECGCAVALRVEHNTVGAAWASTTLARAHGYRGNALRATGNLNAAERPLNLALQLFETEGNGDPLIAAELASLKASLRFDQRRLDEAEELLDGALTIYNYLGEQTYAARILIKQGRLFAERSEPEAATLVTMEAARRLDEEKDTKLYLATQHNLSVYLSDLGEHEKALSLLEQQRPLFEQFQDPWTLLRHRWHLAVLNREMGQGDQAIRQLSGVRNAFVDLGHAYDAALVGLDLALVYLKQGNLKALRQLTDELVPVFLQNNLDREAVGALLLFRQAVEEEKLTASMVSELIETLRAAKRPA